MLKINDFGPKVAALQKLLNKVKGLNLLIDGKFGPKTENAVRNFQVLYKLKVDGIVGPKTLAKIRKAAAGSYARLIKDPKFVVFIDAGHGGENDGKNMTRPIGKYYFHAGQQFHKGGLFLEGVENRIVAERLIEKLTKAGIMCIRTYHPYLDYTLSHRAEIVKGWLNRGYIGHLHSIHSNAISTSYPKEKLDSTTGFCAFNTKGDNFSDKVTTQHYKHIEEQFEGENWKIRKQLGDGDPDYEANFAILRKTDLAEFDMFSAQLDERGFFTSLPDAKYIYSERCRWRYINAVVDTCIWVKNKRIAQLKGQNV